MTIANTRPLHRVLALASMLLALALGTPSAQASGTLPAGGTWESATNLLWAQGPRFYDRSTRQFYTENVVINASSEPVTGPVRLLITSSSHPVVNADGEEDGQPYFTVLDTGETLAPNAEVTVTARFQPQRARFSYDMVVQQYVVADSDNDGIPDTEDLCPTDPQNRCFTINGEVYGGGAALAGANVVIGNGAAVTTVTTNVAGRFSATGISVDALATDNLNRFFPVEAQALGYADAYAKVVLVPGTTTYEVVLQLDVISDRITDQDDLAQGVPIEEGDQTVGSIQIPTSALPGGVTQITGEVTYLDPATELDLAPGGDLLALPAGADPNDPPTPLESYGMMKFDLVDQNGAPIHQLAGDAEVCMRAPTGLAEGDSLPLWYYDETRGLWIEEGQGTVVDRNGQLMICGMVSHFTWWNYDRPVTTHSCFKYYFVDEITGMPLDSVMDWQAQGVTYNGTSPERTCNRDSDDPVTGSNDIEGLTVKRSSAANTEQIRVFTLVAGVPYYLVQDGDGTYSLTTNPNQATVFDNPQAQGSCLYNNQVENCRPLDYLDASPDGILPLDTDIDYPPVITDFIVTNDNLSAGSSTVVEATVTDPENAGPVTLSWSQECWSGADGAIAPVNQTGPSGPYNATFTAPTSVPGYHGSCRIELTATDVAGNSATATRWVGVYDTTGQLLSISGTVTGTDGLPLANHSMLIGVLGYCDTVLYPVQTSATGEYHLEADLSNGCAPVPGTDAVVPVGIELELGIFYNLTYDFGGLTWEHDEEFWPSPYNEESSCVFGDDQIVCTRDLFLPTVWSSLTGNLLFSEDPDHIRISTYYTGNSTIYDLAPGQTSYGPIPVPVGQIRLSATLPTSGRTIQAVRYVNTTAAALDFGDLAAGNVSALVLDTDGDPVSGGSVELIDGNYGRHTATTNDNGEVSFTNIATGTITLFDNLGGRALGYLTENGDSLFMETSSSNTCTVVGFVFAPDGTPIANESFYVASNSSYTLTTGANGAYTLTDVSPGDFSLYDWPLGVSDVFYIPNCLPDADGDPPLVRWDVLLRPYTY